MGLPYKVELTPRAVKELNNLPRNKQKKIVRVLETLETTPRPAGAEKLTDNPPLLRIKAGGDHRIIYFVNDDLRGVAVATIRDRKDAYRNLQGIDSKAILAALKPFFEQPRPTTGMHQ